MSSVSHYSTANGERRHHLIPSLMRVKYINIMFPPNDLLGDGEELQQAQLHGDPTVFWKPQSSFTVDAWNFPPFSCIFSPFILNNGGGEIKWPTQK